MRGEYQITFLKDFEKDYTYSKKKDDSYLAFIINSSETHIQVPTGCHSETAYIPLTHVDIELPYDFDLLFDVKTEKTLRERWNNGWYCRCKKEDLTALMKRHDIVIEGLKGA